MKIGQKFIFHKIGGFQKFKVLLYISTEDIDVKSEFLF
jgi:hypothetical protein